MSSLYFFCLLIGGIFVLMSALAGFDGPDFDLDFDTDLEINHSQNTDRSSTKGQKHQSWLPVFSWKFWTFGSCFFGLTGILLSNFAPQTAPIIILWLSIIIGLICGTTIAFVLKYLQRRQTNSMIEADEMIGAIGIVEIPFNYQSKGKIKINLKNSQISCVALTQEISEFQRGDRVLVVGVENSLIWVVAHPQLEQAANE